MNLYIATGRLTKNPELKSGNGKSYCQFSIAVQRSYVRKEDNKPQVDFIDCVVWGNAAENLAKWQTKGNMILIEGELQKNTYQNNHGENKTTYQVLVNRIEYLSKKNDIQKNSFDDTAEREEEITPYTFKPY